MPESVDQGRRRFIGAAAAAAFGAGLISSAAREMACAAVGLSYEGVIPSLGGATEWLNSPSLTPTASLRGKVALIDFWTYTCVNWLRTLPYVRAWAEKYRDQGVVVVGVHTPEFPFERDIDNVQWAARDMDVKYPIAVDSDYAIWRAFDNHAWPAVYLADVNGRVRFHHFGEGAYDQTERAIQTLLSEGGRTIDNQLVRVSPRGLEVAADFGSLRSPESYLGYEQAKGSRLQVVQSWTRLAFTPSRRHWRSINGHLPVNGR